MNKLAEIKALLAAITQEPWVAVARHSGNDGTQDEMSGLGWDIVGPPQPMRGQFSRCADAQFVAHSPEYVALLLAVVEAELDGVTPEAKAESNRRLADAADRTQQAAPGSYAIKAKAWEAIA